MGILGSTLYTTIRPVASKFYANDILSTNQSTHATGQTVVRDGISQTALFPLRFPTPDRCLTAAL